jgi:hypothetical protein
MFRGLLVALLLTEGVAWADDPLAQARKAVAESDYTSARTALAAVLAAGNRSPDEVTELYRLSGIVAGALGDARAATDAFTHLLALSPKAALPAGTSPKIKRPFDAAAQFFASHEPLELKIETRAAPPTITLIAVNDPLDMVVRAHVVFSIDGGAEQVKDVTASERTEITLPAARRIDARVAALDAHGNHLIEIGSREVPIVLIGEPPPKKLAAPALPRPPGPPGPSDGSAPGARPLWLRWPPYAIAAVAFGGATAYLGLTARSAVRDLNRIEDDSGHHTARENQSAKDRASRDVLLTNIGLGVSGACAITAAVMWYTARGRPAESQLTAVPVVGGGALVLGGNF